MPRLPYDALTVANWFVAFASANDADLSNLKLQKLLYYAQGYHLAINDKPLFDDPIQAWAHGPVVREVYHRFKIFGSSDIDLGDAEPFDWNEIDEETTQFLLEIWETFGGIAAWKLRNMTHQEAPWKDHFEDTVRNNEIPPEALRRHFQALVDRRV